MEKRWWTLGESMLVELMQRAQAGEDVGALLLELYANSSVSQPTDEDE